MRSEMTHHMDDLTPHEAKSAIHNRRLKRLWLRYVPVTEESKPANVGLCTRKSLRFA